MLRSYQNLCTDIDFKNVSMWRHLKGKSPCKVLSIITSFIGNSIQKLFPSSSYAIEVAAAALFGSFQWTFF